MHFDFVEGVVEPGPVYCSLDGNGDTQGRAQCRHLAHSSLNMTPIWNNDSYPSTCKVVTQLPMPTFSNCEQSLLPDKIGRMRRPPAPYRVR